MVIFNSYVSHNQRVSIFEPRITKGLAPSMVHFSVSRPSFNGESCHARLARRKRDLGGAWIVGDRWKLLGPKNGPQYGTPLHSFSQQISVWFLRPSQVVSHNHSLDHTHAYSLYNKFLRNLVLLIPTQQSQTQSFNCSTRFLFGYPI